MVISGCDQITPERLREILMADGSMQRGRVVQIACDTESFNKGFVSNIARLTLTYSEDASGALPSRLILKTSKPGMHVEYLNVGMHEIQFYQAMRRFPAQPVAIPHCYDAQYDPNSGHSHLLID